MPALDRLGDQLRDLARREDLELRHARDAEATSHAESSRTH